MSEDFKRPIIGESFERIAEALHDVDSINRHEGIKRVVEFGLYAAGHSKAAKWVLEQYSGSGFTDPLLETEVAGMQMNGVMGVAAGWDKTGKTILGWQALGARHMTVGGVPRYGQPGKPMPRLWTMDEALGDHGKKVSLNSFGFPSVGAFEVRNNIFNQRELGEVEIPVIVQVTLNADMYQETNFDRIPEVLADTIKIVEPAADAISLGLSSFNTENMRNAQDNREMMHKIVGTSKEAMPDDKPMGYKFDADGGEKRLEIVCSFVEAGYVDFLEGINTTGLTEIKRKYNAEDRPGGLGGADPDYQRMANDAVRQIYDMVGDQADIIGMGGINNGERAIEMIQYGASAAAMNTGIRELGGKAMVQVELELLEKIRSVSEAGTSSLNELIGSESVRGPKSRTVT